MLCCVIYSLSLSNTYTILRQVCMGGVEHPLSPRAQRSEQARWDIPSHNMLPSNKQIVRSNNNKMVILRIPLPPSRGIMLRYSSVHKYNAPHSTARWCIHPSHVRVCLLRYNATLDAQCVIVLLHLLHPQMLVLCMLRNNTPLLRYCVCV